METRTLVLTKNYLPHQIISWTEAITSLFTGKAEVVESHDGDDNILATIYEPRIKEFKKILCAYPSYSGGCLDIRTPSVVRLKNWDSSIKLGVKFSRVNVFTRDNFKCQYCGSQKGLKELTFDHVLPRSSGGKTYWENIVSSCYPCNSKKSNRTPEQAGMKLKRKPFRPKSLPMIGLKFSENTIHPNWIPYFGESVENKSVA
jgi:5-methylcytosine-specific restriction endonuclease McrA